MASPGPKHKSDLEKIEIAKQFKSEGNECHKQENFKQAIGKYHRALMQLKAVGSSKSAGLGAFLSDETMQDMGYSEPVSESTRHEVTKLMCDCYNNLSACLLKQDAPNHHKILEYCDKVTDLDPSNAKAHYRKGLAYYSLEKYEEAVQSFSVASKLDSSFQASKYIRQCKEGIRKQDQQLKDAYRGIFNKGSRDSEAADNG
ncbi:tetratricopeptide repeat protein 9C-like [Dreissena polymorpha]|uniref:Uncharacterized protein n=1 Tax=Dreissena polymorpha TaxID=45954 RepID=A0A9D4QZP0_DREPO|nr:tetratricopeptide repeat protein 9C-like [Dreissena polymorpha]KAH3847980.1 hypothetical protein DPMN_090316 [Dreissena polymorpha]